jgi:hypothetical protein
MQFPTTLHLHVGQPKTGTTTLQRALFRRHPEVFYLGQYVPSDHPMHCLSDEVYQLLLPLLWDTSRPLDLSHSQERLARIHASAGGTERRWVPSWEGLIHRHPARFREMIERVLAVFGDCRIVLTLRNPLNRIPSEYLENLKGHFIKGNHSWMGEMPYVDLEQWLQRASTGEHLANMLSYGSSIQEAVRILGVDRVGVFLFEDLRANSSGYHSDICSFLQIDPIRGMALTNNQHLHRRMSRGRIDLLKRLNDSPVRQLFMKFAGREYRKSLFYRKSKESPFEKAELPAAWASRVAAETSPGHRWIADTFRLPLIEHGYPLDLPSAPVVGS